MKRETQVLKVAVFLIGLPVLALCIFLIPEVISITERNGEFFYLLPLFIIYLYFTAIPFYYALLHAYKLLQYIDQNKAFSERSIKSLKIIRYCATIISVMYVISLPIFYIIAEMDDAPGLLVIGLVITFSSLIIAVFAAVLQKLFKNANDIKSENDLTV
ncbi:MULTISPECIES: DUF2975 domain-containing protein [Oceanobacillus]|uniref:Membrane protein YoaS n=1 Tax=Oceanobacillus kimchii TaxID=746691 RepID=A0ABQ5TF64_9BACI|nr:MULTISPECIES: DUF2975 domain-containing protein [Oceanobacillus]MBT2652994.1 DUF2975 domain-containing protein [Oceanobacillus sp. ISL-73]MCT1577597.1 DUF2975 domain-containing protein [Oceanobacillus kimchii]MCT2136585.1 DUF2975 domain-containing protein [Oceanobacillus kimchii]OEH53726.1 hypothetical protein AQ616_14690 [Oceanobacillus sp. E9]GLO64687.1 putative membrane protein YoaS [Oceanobacillus kimchii]